MSRSARLAPRLLLLFVATVVALGVAEIGLRLAGREPGFIPRYNSRFERVEELEVKQTYFTDDSGIFRANPDHDWSPGFRINSLGFRSIDFETEGAGPSILLLGDSFTWGASATPITNSFADLVAAEGYLVFNTGIPGTAPSEYAAIAERFVPRIEPDFVAIMFYMGNDVAAARPMRPNKNRHHITNAGWLYAYDEQGRHMSAEEAYEKYLRQTNLLYANPRTLPPAAVLRSVVASYVWSGWVRLEPRWRRLLGKRDRSRAEERRVAIASTRRALDRIRSICDRHSARLLLFLIPAHPQLRNRSNRIEDNLGLFSPLEPLYPDNLRESDYVDLPNGHFNNTGHRKYADFILGVLARERAEARLPG